MPLDHSEQDHDENPGNSGLGRRAVLTLSAGAALAAVPTAAAAATPAKHQATAGADAASPHSATPAAGHWGHHPIEHLTRIPGLASFPSTSLVVAGTGKMIALASQLPVNAAGEIVSADPLAQARQIFANITTALRAVGAGPRNVLKVDVVLIDLADFPALATAYGEFIDPDNPPANSLVQVAGLVRPGVRIQADVLAVV